jgi:hypothetical protein
MTDQQQGLNQQSRAAARDNATRRVRRFTAGALAAATALTGAFFGVAAGSSHSKQSASTTTTTNTKTTAATVTAPTPTLVPSASSNETTTTTTTTPATAPSVAQSDPVVVSGGS